MLRYVQATMNALEISIACNALHPVTARCARWLLTTQDRVNSADFWITQEFLAVMLGVRRATVNSVERELQEQHAIKYVRGHVQILNRAALEAASCECYRLTIDRYKELLRQAPFVPN
jgi:CRP-like cAMP-binding protein